MTRASQAICFLLCFFGFTCYPAFSQQFHFFNKPPTNSSQTIFVPAYQFIRPKPKPLIVPKAILPKDYRPWWGLLSAAILDVQNNGGNPEASLSLQDHPDCQTNVIAQSILQRHGQAVLDSTAPGLKVASYHASLTQQATKNMGVFVEHLQCLDRSGVQYWDDVLSTFLTNVAKNNPPEISLCEAFWTTWSPALNVIDLLQTTGQSKLVQFYQKYKYEITDCTENHLAPSGPVAMLTPFSGDKLVLLSGTDKLENLLQAVTDPLHLGVGLCPLIDHANGLMGGSHCTNGFSQNSGCSLDALNNSLTEAGLAEASTSSVPFPDGSGFSIFMEVGPPSNFFGTETRLLPQKLGLKPHNCDEESEGHRGSGNNNDSLGASFAAPTGFTNSCLLSHAHERKTSSHGYKMATCAKKYAPPGASLNTQGETITMAESECGLVQGSDEEKKPSEQNKDKTEKKEGDPKESDPNKKDSNKDKSDKEKNDPNSKGGDHKPWWEEAKKTQKDPLSQKDKDILFKLMNDVLKSIGRKSISKKVFNNGYKDIMKQFYILNTEAAPGAKAGVNMKDQSEDAWLWAPDTEQTVGYLKHSDQIIAVSPYEHNPVARKGVLIHEFGHAFAEKLGISQDDYHKAAGHKLKAEFFNKYFQGYTKKNTPGGSGSQMQTDFDGSPSDSGSCHETESQRRVRLLGNCMFGNDEEIGELPDAPIDALSYPDPLEEDPICSEYNGSELRKNSGSVVDPSPMEDFQQQPEPQPNSSNQFIDPPKPEPGF